MRNRLISTILTLALLLALLPGLGVQVAAEDADYIWPEMLEGIAMRYTVNRTESTRIMVDEIFQVEFWINGIAPYSMVIPLCWDPSIVEMVDAKTGEPVESGRKLESDTGIGFRPGACCFDSSYDDDYMPLYWNGKPVYSDKDSSEGYPYIDNEHGYCTFLYYVDAATASAGPQLFLELTFKALKRGEPNFRFATDRERYYDPASPEGLTMGFSDLGVIPSGLEMPGVFVIASHNEETIVPVNPGVRPPDRDPVIDPTPTPRPRPTPTPQQPVETAPPAAEMIMTEHLDYFPYSTPVYTQATVRQEAGQDIQETDNYILPASTLAEAINQLVNSASQAMVVRMPELRIDKDDYTISFTCANLDDLVNRMNAMIYFETPYGFVGVNPAALLAQVENDKAEVTLIVNKAKDGIKLGAQVNGEKVSGFKAPVFLLILPYEGEGEPLVSSSQVFGTICLYPDPQPLTISRKNAATKTVSFFTPSVGTFTLAARSEKSFEDLSETHWAAEAVLQLSAAGIVKGRSETKYVPDGKVTRAEMAKLITCVLSTYQTTPDTPFDDVPTDQWFYPYVASAYNVGIINGQTATHFGSDAEITRQDMAVMAYRGLKLLGVELRPTRGDPNFTDWDEVADYAKDAVDALYRAGLLNGMGNGTFSPKSTTTRAQAAQMIYGVYKQVRSLL